MPNITPLADTEVTITEQGTLLSMRNTVDIDASSTFNIEFTVPTGKKWKLKTFKILKDSGTFNISQVLMSYRVDDATETTRTCSFWGDESGAAAYYKEVGAEVTLSEGMVIRCTITTAGYSVAGVMRCEALVQQSDA